MLDHLFAAIIIGLVLGIPGVLLSFALLKGINLGAFNKALLGLLLGVLASPMLALLEFTFLGLPTNALIVYANAVLLAAAGIFALHRNGQLKDLQQKLNFKMPEADLELAKKIAVPVLLLAVVAFAFHARIATAWSPIFYEFDPYYYNSISEFIVKQGSAPVYSDVAYFPEKKFHRDSPLSHYMTAEWYLLYNSILGRSFEKDAFTLTVQVYPPLVAAFMAFLAFLLAREEYGDHVGLMTAAFFAFTPQLIKKMGAGVSEQAPFGLFAAMLVFAFVGLAVRRKSYRFGLLAGASMAVSLLGSSHYIWPFLIVSMFVFFKAIAEFFVNETSERTLVLDASLGAGAIIGNVVLNVYQATPFYSLNGGTLLVVFSSVFSAMLYFVKQYHVSRQLNIRRRHLLAGLSVVFLLLVLFSPLNAPVLGFVNSSLGFARSANPLYKTVQEGGASNEGFFFPSYGYLGSFKLGKMAVINPNILLAATAFLAVVPALALLWKKQRKTYFWMLAVLAFIGLFVNFIVDEGLRGLSETVSDKLVSSILLALADSEVFAYLTVAVAGAMVYYIFSEHEKRSELPLLGALIIIPVAYIGFVRVKYIVHFSFALAFAGGWVIGGIAKLLHDSSIEFNVLKPGAAATASVAIVLLLGVPLVYGQYTTTDQSKAELGGSRIPYDWLETMKWMRENLSGQDRVISWWDYGHWTMYFAEKKTVLDPGNVYPDYDQQTAHAFVEGTPEELASVMRYHGATYAMIDNELIYKWGALVYLSGTWDGTLHNDTSGKFEPKIDPERSPGGSDYEAEHYFEQLHSVYATDDAGQIVRATCPGINQLPMYFSNLVGVLYCMDTAGNLFYLEDPASGKTVPLKPGALIRMGDDSSVGLSPLGQNTNIYYNANPAFLNLNPDLETVSKGRLKSKLVNSNFVKMFFQDALPGFQQVYRSPNGLMKVYKLL